MARPGVVRGAGGGSGRPHGDRRRRHADLRDVAPPSGAAARSDGLGPAGACPRRLRNARARRHCVRTGRRRDQRLRLHGRRDRSGGDRTRRLRRALLPARPEAARAARAAPAAPAPRASGASRLRGGARLPPQAAAAARGLRSHPGGAGRARPRDLALRPRGRRRAVSPPVLRHGAAPLPRRADPVHGERARGAGVAVRRVPRRARRPGEPGARHRAPLLPPVDRPGGAGRADPRGRGGAAPCSSAGRAGAAAVAAQRVAALRRHRPRAPLRRERRLRARGRPGHGLDRRPPRLELPLRRRRAGRAGLRGRPLPPAPARRDGPPR